MKMIKNTICLNMKDVWMTLLFILCGGAFGGLMEFVIDLVSGENGVIGIASIVGGIVLLAYAVFALCFAERESFNLAISMGRTRKSYIPARYFAILINIAVSLVGFFVICGIEYLFSQKFTTFEYLDILQTIGLPVIGWVIIVIVTPIIEMFFGICYVKWERKFFWGLWVVWMLLFVGGPRVLSAMEKHPQSIPAKIGFFIQKVVDIHSPIFLITAAVLVIIIAVADYKLYMKQAVTV